MNDPVTITLPREVAMVTLYRLMTDTSQYVKCAGWFRNWEDIIPPVARKILETGKQPDGDFADVTVQQAQTMCAIADALGSWVKPIWNEPRFRLESHVPPSERKDAT